MTTNADAKKEDNVEQSSDLKHKATTTSNTTDATNVDAKKGDNGEQSVTSSDLKSGDATTSNTTDDATSNTTAPDNRGPGKEGDLIIRDGFPALYIPKKGDSTEKNKPMVEGEEPLPRHGFWSSEKTIEFNNPDHLRTLREDCETVFTARDKPDGATYSAGQTYFLPANMKPRCALEAMAMKIFQEHTKHLEDGTFNPAQSGANWWTLVMDDDDAEEKGEGEENTAPAVAAAATALSTNNGAAVGVATAKTRKNDTDSDDDDDDDDDEEEDDGADEVGLHFDADYELEEQTGNIMLHPRVATITYLSDYGAPTLILDQKSPPMDDMKKTTLETGISKAWLSHPKLGKHTIFDGRFLHGAPALYFPSRNDYGYNNSDDNESKEPATKRQKVEVISTNRKRYTLLVNIWLNHWVMDAGLLEDEVCAALKTPWEDEKSNLKGDDSYKPPFVWNKDIDLTKPTTQMEKVKLAPSNVDPAGEDEIALCNHNITVKYNPLMSECHAVSFLGSTVELELEKNTISLHVGEELSAEEDYVA